MKSKLDYTKFLSAFEEGRGDAYPDTPPDVQHYKHFDSLTPEKADTKLKRFVSDQSAALTAVGNPSMCLALSVCLGLPVSGSVCASWFVGVSWSVFLNFCLRVRLCPYENTCVLLSLIRV